jgi:hypothetical protein
VRTNASIPGSDGEMLDGDREMLQGAAALKLLHAGGGGAGGVHPHGTQREADGLVAVRPADLQNLIRETMQQTLQGTLRAMGKSNSFQLREWRQLCPSFLPRCSHHPLISPRSCVFLQVRPHVLLKESSALSTHAPAPRASHCIFQGDHQNELRQSYNVHVV